MKQQQYKEKLTRFFELYSTRRREWLRLLDGWRQQASKKVLRAQIEGLMAQIEDYHTALKEMLAQETPDMGRIQRMHKQMRKCYKELAQITKPQWQQWAEAIIFALAAAFVLRTYVFGLYHVPTGSAEPNVLVGDRLWGNKFPYLFRKPRHNDLVIFDDPEFQYDRSSGLQRLWQKYVGFPILGILKQGPQNWVKRVIGVPGDKIEGRMENNRTVVYRNGERLDEVYVNPHPLLVVRKEVGLFSPHSALGGLVPSFFHGYSKQVRYTYDESKSFEDQPYYFMKPEEVVRHAHNGEPLMFPSGSPSYNRYGKNGDVYGPFIVPEGKYWVMGDSRLNSGDSRIWGFLDHSLVQGRAGFVVFSIDSEEPFWLFALLKNPIHFFTKAIRWNRFLKGLWSVPNLRGEVKAVQDSNEGAHE